MFKNYLEVLGKDTRSKEDKMTNIKKYKKTEAQVIEYANNYHTNITAWDLDTKSGYEDLVKGDIAIRFGNSSAFNIDVKKGTTVSLKSILKFQGPYYLFVIGTQQYMVMKKEIKKWLSEFPKIDGRGILDIKLDDEGNLNSLDTELFLGLQKISHPKAKLIIMSQSKTPGIKLDPKNFWNTLNKFLDFNLKGNRNA